MDELKKAIYQVNEFLNLFNAMPTDQATDDARAEKLREMLREVVQ